jgi:hypothetical protein
VVDADHEPRARIALIEEMQMAAVTQRISGHRDGSAVSTACRSGRGGDGLSNVAVGSGLFTDEVGAADGGKFKPVSNRGPNYTVGKVAAADRSGQHQHRALSEGAGPAHREEGDIVEARSISG